MLRRRLAPLVAAPFVLGAVLTGTASAAPAAPAASFSSSVEAGTAADLQPGTAAALPAVRLAKVGGSLQFSRHSIAVPRTAASPVACTARNAGFVITNGTAVRQPLRAAGKAFGAVPAKGRVYVCGFSTRAFSATFVTVNNPGNKLVARFR